MRIKTIKYTKPLKKYEKCSKNVKKLPKLQSFSIISHAHGVRRQTSVHICVPPWACPHGHRKQHWRRRPAACRSILGGTGLLRTPNSGHHGPNPQIPMKIVKKVGGGFEFGIPRHAPAAKFVVQSSYIHDPSGLSIGTGPRGACVIEVTFRTRWGAPVNRCHPQGPPMDV